MGTPFLNRFRKHASLFLHEKYNDARLFLSDLTEAELLAEEATDNEPGSPDAKTMTRIAEASYDIDDYWRIVDVLHRRLYKIDWKQWRKSYKSLVLLDFLLTHGPEEFADEFDANIDVIQELGSFKHIDERGIDWGLNMQRRSERILQLLEGRDALIAARLKALRITNEIQGFGNSGIDSPLSSSSSSGSSSIGSNLATSSSSGTSSASSEVDVSSSVEEVTRKHTSGGTKNRKLVPNEENTEEIHHWNVPRIQEINSLLDKEKGKISELEKPGSFVSGICGRLGISPRGNYGKKNVFASVPPSDGGTRDRRLNRLFSIG